MSSFFNLPELWQLVPIGSLCSPIQLINAKNKSFEDFQYIDISSIDNQQKAITNVSKVVFNEAPSRARQIVETNDVLVSTTRPRLNAVAIVPDYLNGEICSTGFCVLRPKQNLVEPGYLFAWVRHTVFIENLVRLERGISYPAVSDKDVGSVKIPLPPLPEQSRIVRIMHQVDELRRLRGEAVNKVSRLTSSVFDEILGNPAINSKGWPIEPLGRLIIGTPQNGLYKHSSSYGEGTPIVRITDFYEGRLNAPNTFNRLKVTQDELDKYRLENSNVLVNRVNSEEFLGKCALVEGLTEPTVFESNMMRLVVDREQVTPRYLSYFLNTNHARKQILKVAKRAVNQASINQQDVMNFRVPIPSWEAMEKFETTILAAYKIEQISTDSLKGINDLFKSILAQAFTGELTARWRRHHEAELLEAARTRDALLSKSVVTGAASTAGTTTLTPEATVTHPAPPEREEMVAFLSRKQQRVLDLANRMIGYFTLEELSDYSNALSRLPLSTRLEANALSHADLRQGLQLLAALGLVMRVRVGTEPTKNELIFTPAYRRLLPSQDDSRLRDLDRLGANGG